MFFPNPLGLTEGGKIMKTAFQTCAREQHQLTGIKRTETRFGRTLSLYLGIKYILNTNLCIKQNSKLKVL